ncbi:MAG: type II toxin-antitoxin system HicA family toxin [Candidatus Latescibacteria bacterium]|nr:type II toxin-antitoxin system HicA family toxin [Candidatus Latescibacterota bacterium]
MSRLPRTSGGDCVKALGKVGFYLKRQHGSHLILRRDDPFSQVVVPNHRELDRGTLRAIIRQSGLSVNEFVRLL